MPSDHSHEPSDHSHEHRPFDALNEFSSASARLAADEAAHAQVAEAIRGARLAGYKSPLRRLIERLLPGRRERDS
jgi:hypothetical protein